MADAKPEAKRQATGAGVLAAWVEAELVQRVVAHLVANPQPPASADVALNELLCTALGDETFDASQTLLPMLQVFGWTAGEFVAGQFVEQLDAEERAQLAHSLTVGAMMAAPAPAATVRTAPGLRAACAVGGRVVVLDPEAGDIMLSGDWETDCDRGTWAPGTGPLVLADGTTLRGEEGTIRGHGVQVVGGASVRIEDVAIIDNRGSGVYVCEGATVAVQGCRIAGSQYDGIRVNGAGSTASLTGVVVENSGDHGVYARDGGAATLRGCTVRGSRKDDHYETGGGRIIGGERSPR